MGMMGASTAWDHPWRRAEPLRPIKERQGSLTPAQRDEIRARLADQEDVWSLATEYGVTASTIRNYK